MESSHLDTSQKLIAMGVGFVFGGMLAAIGIMRRWLPDKNRAKRVWVIVALSFIVGIALVITGVTLG